VTTARNGTVDCARFVAALGIVWFHSQAPGAWIASVALPVFLILLLIPLDASPGQRARRLLVPFVTWSLVYAMLRTALALKQHDAPFGWWDWTMVFSGTWIHLWVLPFAFVAALLAPWFQHPLASLGAALLTAFLIVVKGPPDLAPFGQWSQGVIPMLVGIAFMSWGWRLAVITLAGSWLVLHLGQPSPDNFTFLVGTALALGCLLYRLPASAFSDWCGRLSLTVYLAHPLMIILGQSLRITWVELALFSLVASVIFAQILETAIQASRRGRLEF
jgi:fucose 4-O-acetylase-like acetyltransferase